LKGKINNPRKMAGAPGSSKLCFAGSQTDIETYPFVANQTKQAVSRLAKRRVCEKFDSEAATKIYFGGRRVYVVSDFGGLKCKTDFGAIVDDRWNCLWSHW
jgi:hypothetical protein